MISKLSKAKAEEMITNPPHGIPLTDKQLKYFHSVIDGTNTYEQGGWLDKFNSGGKIQEYQPNYNESSISIPKDYIGEGYNTKGRNYSPAWGGSFDMGGMIPGTVGFQYSRHGAPSNGKHAKKTLPSTEDGNQLQLLDQLQNFNNFGQSTKWLEKYK